MASFDTQGTPASHSNLQGLLADTSFRVTALKVTGPSKTGLEQRRLARNGL
jgi:hypothetical protein